MSLRGLLWSPPIAWMAAIFVASSMSRLPGGATIPDWISHGTVYAVLGGLLCRALASGAPGAGRELWSAVAIATLYGVSDECHQYFVPGRQAEVADVVKDLAGSILGAWLWTRTAPQARTEGA
jgi:VanZ family protein